jgi:membrane protein implicated in regulation of membrane protease activity
VKIITTGLWVIIAIFALNTVATFFSKTLTEAIIFAPLTLLSAILCYRTALKIEKAKCSFNKQILIDVRT